MAEYTVNQMTYNGDTYQFQDTISGYTTATGTLTDIQVGGTSVVSNGVANITITAIINLLYPIGSYYETTDESFNPSSAGWPGTWSLETAGQVHVSAGTGYTLGSTGGAVSYDYIPAGTVAGKALDSTDYWPAHTHGSDSTSPACYIRRWGSSSSNNLYMVTNVSNVTVAQQTGSTSSRARVSGAPTVSKALWKQTFSESHSHSAVGASTVSTHTHSSTGSAGAVTGTLITLPNTQPYVIVNRWHRTA